MKKFFVFVIKLGKASKENDILSLANELTFKILLAIFPFLIFLMSLVGFFNLDAALTINEIKGTMPESMYNIIDVFVEEVIDTRSAGILSVSLLVAMLSASSGFSALIKGINKAYGQKETRNFIHVRLLSIALVFVLTASIIVSTASLIFGDAIYGLILKNFEIRPIISFLYSFAGYLLTMFILMFAVMIIYKFSSCRKVKFYNLIPGAATTLVIWILTSKIFNIYINNFSRFSKIYGSIASIIIMIYWLDIISVILLVGAEVNALLEEKHNFET